MNPNEEENTEIKEKTKTIKKTMLYLIIVFLSIGIAGIALFLYWVKRVFADLII